MAEATGWLAGPIAAARTFAPATTAALADRLASRRAPWPQTGAGCPSASKPTWWPGSCGSASAPAPRLVVLCGHDARADNNPMESGLACGACGGNGGGPSAQAVAAMANDPEVRVELAERGTSIPDGTWFLAAVHETGTDRVELLDLDLVPGTHRAEVASLEADLAAAGRASADERAASLPGRRRRHRRQRARARDWAEPVPEAGLAGNMAFVIGPRSLTAHLQLDRRVFLHSYEPEQDHDGSVLGGILTAPLIVGQWISAQYATSTTDPEQYGSGSKVVHNPVGDIGVLSGPGGDLRRGLSLQSVRCGDRLLHEPVRLLAVVEGDLAHIDAAIAGSATLRQLVEHEWIHLVARSGPDEPWQQRSAVGWMPREEAA
ncbi:MAG: putative inorganic carbon transporter subunit DabA [Acidimicrobiales bacterium]